MKSIQTRIVLAAAALALALAARVQAQDPNAPTSGQGASQMSPTGENKPSGAGPSGAMNGQDARTVISSWPDNTKKAAQALIEKYGQPDGVTDRMLVWHDKDQWQKVAVFRDSVKHEAPFPHQDFLENTINYKVPESKIADLIKFDQGLVIDETRGTLASHCDSEEANTLALNLANDIVTGKRSASSARSFMRDTMMKSAAGKSSPYMQRLQFEPNKTGAPGTGGFDNQTQPSQPQGQPEAPNQPVTPPTP